MSRDQEEIEIEGEATNLPAHVRPRVERLFDDQDLSKIPGHYYRAVSDIAARREKFMRDASRYSFSRSPERADGKEEITRTVRREVPADVVLLVVSLHFLDEMLHSVEMMPHPTDPDRSNLRFMAEEFFEFFVPAEDADGVRQREIEKVQADIAEVQKRLAAPMEGGPDMLRLPGGGQAKPSTHDLVAAVSRKDDIEKRINQVAEAAQRQMEVLQAATKEIQASTGILGRYYEEKAAAQIALVGEHIQFAKDIQQGLTTLSLYTGEDVEVTTLCEGDPADPAEKLTLYQDVLFLDEELAVDLFYGGFEFQKMSTLGEILSGDATLLDRMIPAPRGVVLVRPRREDFEYFKGDTGPAAAFANAMLNAANKVGYMLVRNGANVHLVSSEITTEKAEHLFPTREEIDRQFKDHFGEEIRPDHLDYSKARSKLDRKTVYYRRMLLMLWGLNDRLGLFGSFIDPAGDTNWYSPEFQGRYFNFIHDAEGTLVDMRPNWADWIRGKNRLLQQGSRLAVRWGAFVNHRGAPGLFERTSRGSDGPLLAATPDQAFSVEKVQRQGDRLMVKCAATKKWGRGSGKSFLANVDVASSFVESSTGAALCLDDVTVEEIDYYITSRRQRRSYLSFLWTLQEVRGLLAEEEARQAPGVAALVKDFMHSGADEVEAAEAIRRAVRLWRSQNGWKIAGEVEEGWSGRDHRTVLDIAFALSSRQQDLMARLRAERSDVTAIEIRIDGRGQLWLYRDLRPEEITETDTIAGRPWVIRESMKLGTRTISLGGDGERAYLVPPDFEPEEIVRRWRPFRVAREESVARNADLAEAVVARRLPRYESHNDLASAVELASIKARPEADVDTRTLGEAITTLIRKHSNGQVAPISNVVPLAVVRSKEYGFGLLYGDTPALQHLASFGDAGLAEALARVKKHYANPLHHVERMRAARATGIPGHISAFRIYWLFSGPPQKHVTLGLGLSNEGTYVNARSGWLHNRGATRYETIEEAVAVVSRYSNDPVDTIWVNPDNRAFAMECYATLEN